MAYKNKKFIYLSPVPLTKLIASSYLYEDLILKHQNVKFWNIGNLIFGENYNSNVKYKFSNLLQLEECLSKSINKNAIFIVLVFFEWRSLNIYRLLSKYNLFTTYIYWGSTKIFSKSSYIRNLFLKSPLTFISRIFQKVILQLYIKFNLIKPFDVLFLAEYYALKHIKNAKRIQHINSPDYEKYYFLNKNKKKEANYAVFLDVNLPFHKDNEIFNFININPEKYYESLNSFFDFIESKFKTKILIAAHPTTSKKHDCYFRKRVVHGNTAELVANSKFVISHHSLSINFAVLNDKPIFFIYTEMMFNLYKFTTVRYIKDLADYLCMPIINIDCFDRRQVKINNVKKNVYKKYKYNFLTFKTTEFKSNTELFSNFLLGYSDSES